LQKIYYKNKLKKIKILILINIIIKNIILKKKDYLFNKEIKNNITNKKIKQELV